MQKLLLLISMLSVSLISLGQCPTDQINLFTQQEVDNFSTIYPGCNTMGFDLIISGADITDLSGLSQITEMMGFLRIHNNPNLVSFNGLSPIQFIGPYAGLYISNNPMLLDISQFSGELLATSGLIIANNPNLTSLAGLSGITQSYGLTIRDNHALVNLNGLEMLDTGEWIHISNNDSLENITALSNVSGSQLEALDIVDNPSLLSLQGLEGITEVQVDGLAIVNNDSLLNLEGLNNLTSVWFSVRILDNEIINDISALENIGTSPIDHWMITNNPNLAQCDIMSLCNYISLGETTLIENNLAGCNSEAEVLQNCLLATQDALLSRSVLLYPNPVSEILQINASEGITIQKMTLFSILGQLLVSTSEKSIDVSSLSEGIYLLEITTDQGILSKKIVKEY